jgi:hypothetical protein
MLKNHDELAAEKLRRVCEPGIFDFRSTAELSTLTEIIGQERAVRATTFGMDIESPGYHIFALGLPGTGKTTMIKDLLGQKSVNHPVPDDWCYINKLIILRMATSRALCVCLRAGVPNSRAI